MKPAAFEYRRARSAEHAVALLREAGEDARLLAGGQSLVPMMNFRLARPSVLIDLGACADLAYIRKDGDRLRIGAMTRQSDAGSSGLVRELCPLLAEALAHAGPLTVRNRATVGGSMANGYPLAQLPCVAVCLGAEMLLQGPRGLRSVSAEEFFVTAMVTAIEPGELLREIAFPCVGPRSRQAFRESGNHAGGPALAIVCGWTEHDGSSRRIDARVAASGLDSKPVRLRHVEQTLLKTPMASAHVEHALVEALVQDVVKAL